MNTKLTSTVMGALFFISIFSVACSNDNEVECDPKGVFDGDKYGSYDITNISDLKRLSGFGRMQGDLFIENTSIDDLNDLRCLSYVAGLSTVSNNDSLTSLDGLDSLTGIGWSLAIDGNDKLRNIDGLIGLKEVGRAAARTGDQSAGTGYLRISNNPELLNLNGLDNINFIYGHLMIKNNLNLPTCQALKIKERLENAGWNGEATICGNLADKCISDSCPTQ